MTARVVWEKLWDAAFLLARGSDDRNQLITRQPRWTTEQLMEFIRERDTNGTDAA